MNKPLKSERIEARVAPDVRELIVAAAELEGRSISEFMVACAKARAEEALHRQSIIELSAEDQHRFVEAILNPPPLNQAMRDAVKLHDQLVEPS